VGSIAPARPISVYSVAYRRLGSPSSNQRNIWVMFCKIWPKIIIIKSLIIIAWIRQLLVFPLLRGRLQPGTAVRLVVIYRKLSKIDPQLLLVLHAFTRGPGNRAPSRESRLDRSRSQLYIDSPSASVQQTTGLGLWVDSAGGLAFYYSDDILVADAP